MGKVLPFIPRRLRLALRKADLHKVRPRTSEEQVRLYLHRSKPYMSWHEYEEPEF